jgi:type I restriction enzyme S subunit
MAEVAPLVRRAVEIDPDASYPELGVRSFGRGVFHKPDLRGAELTWQKLFRIEKGDIVFSNIKAWEGAFAVAGAADHGRVGSHRYLTCVPNEGIEAEFVWFFLQTPQGIEKVQEASPGTADRNRTLGTKALEAIKVPVPEYEQQQAFSSLMNKARQARQLRADIEADLVCLLPALLHRAFGNVEG